MLRFFPQKNKYIQEKSEFQFNTDGPIPQHIAIIMDGNGRWAQNRRLPRVAGHKESHKKSIKAWSESVDALCLFD